MWGKRMREENGEIQLLDSDTVLGIIKLYGNLKTHLIYEKEITLCNYYSALN